MKARNLILISAMLLILIFSAVSCKSEIQSPSYDDSPEGEHGVAANMEVIEFFQKLPFEYIGNDKSIFLGLFADGTGPGMGKRVLLNLAFAKEGKIDSLADYSYIEVDGQKIHEYEIPMNDINIKDIDASAVSFSLDKTNNTLNAEIKDLVFTLEITQPADYSITVDMSAQFSCAVCYSDSRGNYTLDYTKPFDLDVIMDGARWKHFQYDPMAYKAYYDGSEYLLGYTITFDSNGGSAVNPLIVPFGAGIYAEDLHSPAKDGYPFKEWVTADGTVIPSAGDIGSSYFFVTSDITLYAVYYTEAPDDLDGEIYSTYKLAGILQNASDGGYSSDIKATTILNEENLFDLMMITLGKTDSFRSSPYIEIDNRRYYRTKNADEPDGAIYNQDFKYNISSDTGRSSGRSSHGDDETKQERITIELDYKVDISPMGGTAISTIPVHINYATMEVHFHHDGSV